MSARVGGRGVRVHVCVCRGGESGRGGADGEGGGEGFRVLGF